MRTFYVQLLDGCVSWTSGVDDVVAALRAFLPIDVRMLDGPHLVGHPGVGYEEDQPESRRRLSLA